MVYLVLDVHGDLDRHHGMLIVPDKQNEAICLTSEVPHDINRVTGVKTISPGHTTSYQHETYREIHEHQLGGSQGSTADSTASGWRSTATSTATSWLDNPVSAAGPVLHPTLQLSQSRSFKPTKAERGEQRHKHRDRTQGCRS